MAATDKIDACTNYATEKNLMKRLTDLGFAEHSYIVVCNSKGRFTPVFSFHNNFAGKGGYIGIYAQHGFMMI